MLVPGGKLRLVTDHADYFAHMQDMLSQQNDLKVIPFESAVALKADAPAGSIVGTNFERKYRKEGRPIHGAGRWPRRRISCSAAVRTIVCSEPTTRATERFSGSFLQTRAC